MREPILITGAARSGTSIVAGIINMCGAFGGQMSGPNRYNEKGMFENSVIRQTILKPYLRSINVDHLGQFPLPDIVNLAIPTNLRGRMEDVMIKQGYPGGQWMYKGAKMCLTWPIWHYAFPNAKWVIVRRKPTGIINSCLKTGFMKAYARPEVRRKVGAKTEEEGWLWWIHQHEKRFVEMMNQGLDIKVIWPERMINGDFRQMHELIDWLGLEWKSEVLTFIDSKLWKSKGIKKR